MINKSKKIRNLGILNKFLKGAKITKIKPAKLLIKNRGYRRILFQKSFISWFNIISFLSIIIHSILWIWNKLNFQGSQFRKFLMQVCQDTETVKRILWSENTLIASVSIDDSDEVIDYVENLAIRAFQPRFNIKDR